MQHPWTLQVVKDRLSKIGLGEDFPPDSDYKNERKTNLRQQGLRTKNRTASVLILLSSDLQVLLTLRSKKLKSHPGQVSLPGGKQDPSDGGDDVVTALRETKEEVGLDYHSNYHRAGKKARTQVDETDNGGDDDNVAKDDESLTLLCRMPTTEAIGNLCVVPIVALHETKSWERLHQELTLSAEEVETAFWAPLSIFSETWHLTECYDVPDWPEPGETFVYRSYAYEFPLTHQSFSITGLTAAILHQVAVSVCGENAVEGGTGTLEKDGHEKEKASESSSSSNNNNPPLRGKLRRRILRDGNTSKPKYQWIEGFFVLQGGSGSGGILHQYDSIEHALRKQQSATKKNRLRLMPNTPRDNSYTSVKEIEIDNVDDNDGNDATLQQKRYYPFGISTLNGRIQWELSASSLEERALWVERIQSIVDSGDNGAASNGGMDE